MVRVGRSYGFHEIFGRYYLKTVILRMDAHVLYLHGLH